MKVWLERNTGENSEEIPHFICVEIITLTIDARSVFKVPVHTSYQGQKKRFSVEVCGFTLENERPEALRDQTEYFITQLVNFTRLPTYVFIARWAGGIYPVYAIDDDVLATTPGGPVFRHVELAKVREYLSDYLHEVKVLGKEGLSDKLHVRGINMNTLGLRRPVLYLKKRIPGEVDFWAPVFESGDGQRVYTYAANARRETPIEGGQEVVLLRELVAQVLQTDKRLHNLYDLRPDRLMPPYWERLKATLTPQGSIEAGSIEMPLYSNSHLWFGVEIRSDEGRYGLFIGKDMEDVRRQAVRDFKRRGLI